MVFIEIQPEVSENKYIISVDEVLEVSLFTEEWGSLTITKKLFKKPIIKDTRRKVFGLNIKFKNPQSEITYIRSKNKNEIYTMYTRLRDALIHM